MQSRPQMLRRALSVLLVASTFTTLPRPVQAASVKASLSSSATTRVVQPEPSSMQETFSRALFDGQELARAQLDLHDALVRTSPVSASSQQAPSLEQRSRILKSLRLDSPTALRKAAARLRATSHDKEAYAPRLTAARAALAALYPWAASSIKDEFIPLVLEAAATEHDRRALEEAEATPEAALVPLSSLTTGEMIIRAASKTTAASVTKQLLLVSRLHNSYATSLKAAADSALLASRQSSARRAKRAGVASRTSRAAAAAIATTSRSEAKGLAAAWTQAGYRRSNAVLTALAQVNKTYRFANRGPDAFDCSGLTSYAWASSGLDLRTSSFSQRAQVESLGYSPREVLPGDLVFYKIGQNRKGEPSGHVAMVLGYKTLVVEAQWRADQVQVAPLVQELLSSYGRVRLAGEQTDGLLLANN